MSVANRLPRLPALLLAATLGVVAAAITPPSPHERGALRPQRRRSDGPDRQLLRRQRAEVLARYAVSAQPGRTNHPRIPIGHIARITSQGLAACFGQGEVGITVSRGRDLCESGLKLVSWGRKGARIPVLAAAPRVEGIRVEYVRGSLREWYVNDQAGIEQGFTIATPPPDSTCNTPLELDLQVRGELLPVLAPDQQSIRFVDPEGTTAFQYSKLKAWDSGGQALPSRMSVEAEGDTTHVRLAVSDRGATYPLTIDPLITAETVLYAPDGDSDDYLGFTVDVSDDTVVVGAPNHDQPSQDAGAVYIYVKDLNGWRLEQKLEAPDGDEETYFGTDVSIEGDTLVVGAPDEKPAGGLRAGAVYVFTRAGGNWTLQEELHTPTPLDYPEFGHNVEISGNTIAVSAPQETVDGMEFAGAVYLFTHNGTAWEFTVRFQQDTPKSTSSFGSDIALDGTMLIVGVPHEVSGPGFTAGAAYVYRKTTSWNRIQKISEPDADEGTSFGSAVGLGSGTLALGAPHTELGGDDAVGIVHTYVWSGSSWVYHSKFSPPDAQGESLFGWSVAADGDQIVVGAYGGVGGPSDYRGSGHRYRWDGAVWREESRYSALGATSSDGFGSATAMSFNWVVFGARNDEPEGDSTDTGAVYIVALPPTAPGLLTAQPASSTAVRLSWTNNSEREEGFEIYRKTGASGIFSLVAAVGAGASEHIDEGLAPATTYTYRMRAFNSGGTSEYSNVASATTLPLPPLAPSTLVRESASATHIGLRWTDNSTTENGFRVERSLNGITFAEIAASGANEQTYSDTTITDGMRYFYRVRAVNAGGYSSYSNTLEVGLSTSDPVPPSTPPTAPANLSASVASSSSVRLEWEDRSDNESGFRVERSTDGGVNFSLLSQVGAGVPLYRDNGLTANTLYIYRVRALNGAGVSAYSNLAYATTLPLAPTAPAGLTATTISSSEIALHWTDTSTNESGFRLERRTASASFAQHALFGTNTTTFRDRGLDPNTSYTYRLCGLNAGGESAFADETSATTRPAAPESPSGLTATVVSETTIDLTWIDRSANETAFEVERKVLPGPYARIGQPGAGVTSYRDGSLAANSTYVYRVRAVNTGGASGYSEEATATTLPPLPETPAELAVTTISSNTLRLDWTDASEIETGFRIERAPQGSDSFALVTTLRANSTTYRDGGRAADTTYRYRVRAFNARGESPNSAVVEGRTLPQAPLTPSALTLTVLSQTMIQVNWSDQSSNETGFEVERKTGPAAGPGAYALVATVAADGTVLIDGGLAPETQYTYRVRAVNAGGPSAYASAASGQTQPAPPAAPGGIAVSPLSTTAIRITWDDQSTNETGFEVERRIGSAAWTRIATPAAGSTSHDNGGLSAGATYSYRVRSVNAGGTSAFTNEASTSTYALNAPTKLVATTRSTSQIKLTWADGGKGENGFAIERRTGSGSFTEIKRVGANVKTFTDTRLTRGTSYVYRVRAFRNPTGFSAYSNEASAVTTASIGRGR